MNKRPLPLIIVSVGFIAIGTGGLIAGLWPIVKEGAAIKSHDLLDSGLVFVSGVLALVSGVFMLRGANWARWLCIVWMALHVVLSLWHTTLELVIHSLMLIVLLVVLFRPRSPAYFRKNG